MKAVLLKGVGGVEMLRVGDAPIPEPAAGQVLVKVMATSVNRADLVQRQGNYPPPAGESAILGLEVSGVIDKLGPGVSGWAEGERVMSLVGGGGYAEYAVAYAPHLLRIPPSLTFAEAACCCETYVTAFLNIHLIGGLKDGDTVMIHGGGGGVNIAGIQLCRALTPHARIIVTASPRKKERVKEMGVDMVIDYRDAPDFSNLVREFTSGEGVQVILDHVGADYLKANLKSLAIGGRLVIIGVISGSTGQFNLAALMVGRQSIIGSVLRSRSVQEKGEIIARFADAVLPLFAERRVVPVIDRVFALDDVAAAHHLMEEGGPFGKIVLKVADPTVQPADR